MSEETKAGTDDGVEITNGEHNGTCLDCKFSTRKSKNSPIRICSGNPDGDVEMDEADRQKIVGIDCIFWKEKEKK